jgi:hypothetical protein
MNCNTLVWFKTKYDGDNIFSKWVLPFLSPCFVHLKGIILSLKVQFILITTLIEFDFCEPSSWGLVMQNQETVWDRQD